MAGRSFLILQLSHWLVWPWFGGQVLGDCVSYKHDANASDTTKPSVEKIRISLSQIVGDDSTKVIMGRYSPNPG
jgi:hypothetical protein